MGIQYKTTFSHFRSRVTLENKILCLSPIHIHLCSSHVQLLNKEMIFQGMTRGMKWENSGFGLLKFMNELQRRPVVHEYSVDWTYIRCYEESN